MTDKIIDLDVQVWGDNKALVIQGTKKLDGEYMKDGRCLVTFEGIDTQTLAGPCIKEWITVLLYRPFEGSDVDVPELWSQERIRAIIEKNLGWSQKEKTTKEWQFWNRFVREDRTTPNLVVKAETVVVPLSPSFVCRIHSAYINLQMGGRVSMVYYDTTREKTEIADLFYIHHYPKEDDADKLDEDLIPVFVTSEDYLLFDNGYLCPADSPMVQTMFKWDENEPISGEIVDFEVAESERYKDDLEDLKMSLSEVPFEKVDDEIFYEGHNKASVLGFLYSLETLNTFPHENNWEGYIGKEKINIDYRCPFDELVSQKVSELYHLPLQVKDYDMPTGDTNIIRFEPVKVEDKALLTAIDYHEIKTN